jgi:hypothetical protein
MYLLAQTVEKGPLQVHHIYLWQIVAAGSAVLLAAILVVIVLAVNFRRAKDHVEE